MYQIEDLLEIVKKLRSPEGCPWDLAQTHESLIPCMMDETAEVLAAIEVQKDTGYSANLCEELGDQLFLILLQCQISAEEGQFDFSDVVQTISEKMIHRHPQVFAPEKQIVSDWDEIKKAEKVLVPPEIEFAKKKALERAYRDMREHLR
ncbi:MAG: MazG nucleotide pyrophosphohydrolase domain-containing protein [Marvinbryantia sp.]|jgi:uncharacterized protein YabN with tetrapyrrole methylase and pyrophosphatase domain